MRRGVFSNLAAHGGQTTTGDGVSSMYPTKPLSRPGRYTRQVHSPSMYAGRVSRGFLRSTRAPYRCRVPPVLPNESSSRTQCQSASRPGDRRLLSNKRKSSGNNKRNANANTPKSKFPPPTKAASVPFPGKDLRVSRVGFGSPWMGAATDRGLEMSRALSDGQCNLVQLTSEVKRVKKVDKDGKPLLVPEWPERSWETRTFGNMEIPREDLALLWELPAAGKPVKEALSTARAMEHLDRLLTYHGLDYLDAFVMEIPWITGGEEVVNDYRRFTGEAVRLAMTEFVELAGDRVKTLGFSWQGNPHTHHPGRAPDSPLSDVVELRDLLAPSKPLVAMFPVGVGCGASLDGSGSAENGGIFGLPESAGVFQIGTSVTHARRVDGRPFRLVDVNPRPVSDIVSDLKSKFAMAVHMEVEYAKRFEGGGANSDGGGSGDENEDGDGDEGGEEEPSSPPSPLPPKADVSWAHILAQNQHKLQGLDEWETIRDSQIKPSVMRALDTLRIRGEAEGEWGFLYRSTLGSLMSGLSEVMEVRKSHQLEEVAALMDELAPSLRSSARGGSAAEAGGSDSDSADDVGDSAGGSKSEGETVIGRCAAAALSTGVDCVLDEEFSASREAGRVAGFPQVPHSEIEKLYSGFKLPSDGGREAEQ